MNDEPSMFPPGFDAIVLSMARYIERAVDEAVAAELAHKRSLLHRVRACVPRSALRFDPTLAQDIDAALVPGMGTVERMHEANLGLWRLGDEG